MNHPVLIIVFAVLCVGCAGIRDSRLKPQRQMLAETYRNEALPMSERMAAFDALLVTFTAGTRESALDQFVGWPVADTKSRLFEPPNGDYEHGGFFCLHLNAPDGSDRWITMEGDRVH